MKTVTLDAIEWQESPNHYKGRTQKVSAIVIHWWNDPKLKPSLSGVVGYLRNPASEVSAHFVVSGDRVIQLVNMNDMAWHSGAANAFTVGIEVDPNVPGNTYETVGALVKFIRGYYGNIPVKRHSDYVSTACPGTLDLGRIDAIARGTYQAPVVKPAGPTVPQLQAEVAGLKKQLADVKLALANEQKQPPKEIVKTVEKIVEKEVVVEVPVYTHDEETKNFIKAIYNYFYTRYQTFRDTLKK